jgi:hypothetical protein
VGDAVGADGLIALMPVLRAAGAFFFDVVDLSVRRELMVPARDAAAGEGSEAEKANKTHGRLLSFPNASGVPAFEFSAVAGESVVLDL